MVASWFEMELMKKIMMSVYGYQEGSIIMGKPLKVADSSEGRKEYPAGSVLLKLNQENYYSFTK